MREPQLFGRLKAEGELYMRHWAWHRGEGGRCARFSSISIKEEYYGGWNSFEWDVVVFIPVP